MAKKAKKGGAGKKGKKGKGKRIVETDEEKRARLEAEMLMKEEERRRKEEEERKAQLKKQKDEESVAKRNAALTLADVRQRARQAKKKELEEEADIVSQTYERKIDQRDAIIESLFRDLEEAERQYQKALRSHLSNLDNLIQIQQERFQVLESEMLEDTEDITKAHEDERVVIMKRHEAQKEELLKILQMMDQRFNEEMAEDKKAFEEEKKALEEQQRNDLMRSKSDLTRTIDILTNALSELHKKYISNTEKQTQEFRLYAKKEQIDAEEIAALIRQIRRNQEQFQRVKKKIQNTVKEYTERNEALARERDAISKHYHELKQKMALFHESQQERLKELTMQSREVTRRLQERIDLADHLIMVAELNRHLETEREKVTPFFPILAETDPEIQERLARMDEEMEAAMGISLAPSSSANVSSSSSSVSASPTGEGEDAEARGDSMATDWSQLNQFFKKANKVLLDKMAIEHEYERMKAENAALQQIVVEYLDSMKVTDSITSPDNPLLMVRPATISVSSTTAASRQAERVAERA
ncbi:putative flagellar associated protein [Monocercomonoides exilis]|uniref:putative flagellar associated protein n=1 Tax=Monocercomonoides exilis TaxID=2049356 RepID=UPI003559D30C|nr:putative flagellar associated protein [Monocercomonoides exilis]|eukprot:MONOS_8697.1-p1 / transcript=MONOS_8697.1 / gene=MONOS_8697 / organism=Monocercomonoides_exilis_PA203 / gene_product=flagellar associated protein / transcript_product=flagellar associated protein / location=Mono_scaffold00335:6644-8617(+) / protein_length=530 / sequence_SO=supercontig / SO=protein_coding / is_pseudo=false